MTQDPAPPPPPPQVTANGLWVYADEFGNPDHVVLFLEAFLTTFRPTQSIGFEWSHTCSKPNVGEFGGGAALVHGDDRPAEWINTNQWLAERGV